ncbi:MAG: hypothetical protein A2Z20_04110 [Bdellovibrionales bacterium RBG_16_40_8]|nr:MAG: hypothetical protein A2Z20_04110 [Bdellovibrionales bacterium RBG_16_40_8]
MAQRQLELANYRIEQAKESLDEANFLFQGNKSLRSVVNRLYYAHFYAISALLIFEKYSSSKHSGVLAYYNKNFIKTKAFDAELGKATNRLFEMRNRGDYREFVQFDHDEIADLIEKTNKLIPCVEEYLYTQKLKDKI